MARAGSSGPRPPTVLPTAEQSARAISWEALIPMVASLFDIQAAKDAVALIMRAFQGRPTRASLRDFLAGLQWQLGESTARAVGNLVDRQIMFASPVIMHAADAHGRGWAIGSGHTQHVSLAGQDRVSLAVQVGAEILQATPSARAAQPPPPMNVPDWPMDLAAFPPDLEIRALPQGNRATSAATSAATSSRRASTSRGEGSEPRGDRAPAGRRAALPALPPALLLPVARTAAGARTPSRGPQTLALAGAPVAARRSSRTSRPATPHRLLQLRPGRPARGTHSGSQALQERRRSEDQLRSRRVGRTPPPCTGGLPGSAWCGTLGMGPST